MKNIQLLMKLLKRKLLRSPQTILLELTLTAPMGIYWTSCSSEKLHVYGVLLLIGLFGFTSILKSFKIFHRNSSIGKHILVDEVSFASAYLFSLVRMHDSRLKDLTFNAVIILKGPIL